MNFRRPAPAHRHCARADPQSQIVICDEPVSALDVSIRAQIINLLLELKETLGLSYIMISHDLGVVEHMSDRVAVMYLGRIVETGHWREIFERPAHPYTQTLIAAIPDPLRPHRWRRQAATFPTRSIRRRDARSARDAVTRRMCAVASPGRRLRRGLMDMRCAAGEQMRCRAGGAGLGSGQRSGMMLHVVPCARSSNG